MFRFLDSQSMKTSKWHEWQKHDKLALACPPKQDQQSSRQYMQMQ